MAEQNQGNVQAKDEQRGQSRNQASPEDATYNAAEDHVAADEQAGNPEAANQEAEQAVSAEELLRHVQELQAQLDESQQRLLRTQADFDNFRRRTRQEKEEFTKYASQKLIEQLLPVVDNFERAMSASHENKDFEALFKGIEMISRQLEQVLAAEGLSVMQTVGQPFDPELHQAVMREESTEHEEGIVTEELQKGYMLKDKVLRPAMVKVSM